jgi:hypothetical protein
MTRKDVYRITEIDLNPSFAPGTFDPSFDDGTEILYYGPAKQLLTGYEWRGGRVVPRISENVMSRVKDVVASTKDSAASGPDSATPPAMLPVKPEKDEPLAASPVRYVYFLVALILGIGLLAVLLYLSHREKKSS